MVAFTEIQHLLHPIIEEAMKKENLKLFNKFKPDVLSLIAANGSIDTSLALDDSQEWLKPVFAHVLEYLAQGLIANISPEYSKTIDKRYSESMKLLQSKKNLPTGTGRIAFGGFTGEL